MAASTPTTAWAENSTSGSTRRGTSTTVGAAAAAGEEPGVGDGARPGAAVGAAGPAETTASEKYPVVCGIELGGVSTAGAWSTFEPLFARARDAGLPVALHCG